MSGELLRFCALAILTVVSGLVVGQVRGEFAVLVRLGGAILLFGALAVSLSDQLTEVGELLSETGVEPYVTLMLRALGIAFLTMVAAGVCRDCGEHTVATGVEMAGKLAIVSLCLPLIGEILAFASEILTAA